MKLAHDRIHITNGALIIEPWWYSQYICCGGSVTTGFGLSRSLTLCLCFCLCKFRATISQ